MFSAEISERKWNSCLGCRRRKVKRTKQPRKKKGKRQRAGRGKEASIPVRSVCPTPALTGAQSGFAVSGIRSVLSEDFRKLSLASVSWSGGQCYV